MKGGETYWYTGGGIKCIKKKRVFEGGGGPLCSTGTRRNSRNLPFTAQQEQSDFTKSDFSHLRMTARIVMSFVGGETITIRGSLGLLLVNEHA